MPWRTASTFRPFFELMADQRLTKVFHAARQDLEIIWNLAKLIPAPLFDTQVAAMVCGFGDQISYGDLVQTVTNVTLDKSSRFTDWSRRPLLPAQVEYAIADVTYLRDIYGFLRAQARRDRQARLARRRDGAAHVALDLRAASRKRLGAVSQPGPQAARSRGPDGGRLLAREPRHRRAMCRARAVLKDDVLIELALAAPRTAEALGNLRAFPRGMERSRAGVEILAAIERGLARDPKTLPKLDRERRNGGNGATVELLKVLLRHVSESHGVAAKMIATVDDLEAIAADDHAKVAALTGWRRELFGAKALELKHGRLALTVEQGKVVHARMAGTLSGQKTRRTQVDYPAPRRGTARLGCVP